MIYKQGDDLRTDQLIIQMFMLMENLMKDLKVDLRLTIYQVLAYGSEDGIMEFVPNSITL
jgi:phosphatidylinositol 3-kinase